jgi:RimJ/RimL family protein N-acetyltransferase
VRASIVIYPIHWVKIKVGRNKGFAILAGSMRDAFVGEEDMLGIGHGARFLRAIALQLCEDGAPDVVIDPDVDNARARRACRRAGFGGDRVCDTGEGPAVVMQFMG